MKNKRLAIILTILTFLVVVITLSSAIFSLNAITVKFLSTTNILTNQTENIINSGDFSYGRNVLFINKRLSKEKIEVANPYINIIFIETIFPNKLIINCVERNEVYCFKISPNTYCYTDENLKVLKTVEGFVNSPNNPIVVNGVVLSTEQAVVGKILEINDDQKSLLNSIFLRCLEWDLSYINLKANIEQITINYERENQISLKMRSGLLIVVKDADIKLYAKMNLAFSIYDENASWQTSGELEIREVNDKIQGYYST